MYAISLWFIISLSVTIFYDVFHVLRFKVIIKKNLYIDNLQNSKNINIYEGMGKHFNDNYNMTFTKERTLNKKLVVNCN